MIPVALSQTVRVGSMIRTDPGSRSLGSDPGIRFRDPRTCLSLSNLLGTTEIRKGCQMQPPPASTTRLYNLTTISMLLKDDK